MEASVTGTSTFAPRLDFVFRVPSTALYLPPNPGGPWNPPLPCPPKPGGGWKPGGGPPTGGPPRPPNGGGCPGIPPGGGNPKPPPGGGGPPTPLTGPPKPTGKPLPAGREMPPPDCRAVAAPPGADVPRRALGSEGGGPSTEQETILVPRRITRPSVRFSSVTVAAAESGAPGAVALGAFLRRDLRNSSVSARTRFMCWKSRKVST